MNWLAWQIMAQIPVERILNALPAGLLIAVFAWVLLRVSPRQNSGTRFAVWFMALLTIAALPLQGSFGEGRPTMAAGMSSAMSWENLRPAITIPGRWAFFVFLAWALGACAAMLRLATGIWSLRRLRLSCTPIDVADLDPAVRRTVEAIGASGSIASKSSVSKSIVSKSITIATSECVRVPAAIGFFKRTIVLPAWALRELSPHDLNVILLHEFAHLRRWDDWTNLVQKIVRALLFFHPAVWWIENRLSVEREMACDDAVLAETANPHGYASCLVSLLEKSLAHRLSHGLAGKRWSMAQAAVHRAREASLRLARILDAKRPVATRVWKPALGMIGGFAMVCFVALPHAPQFVAFDRGTASVETGALARPSLAQLGRSLPSQQLRVNESDRLPVGTTARATTAKPVHVRVYAHDVGGHQLAPAPAVAARFDSLPLHEGVVATSARADQEIVPQFRTLVLIEATRYVTSDSSVWSVQVWQVTLVTQVRERLARVPVAHSI
jgi:beta-lactamase regulating signal transducer with metallopeptidase domain